MGWPELFDHIRDRHAVVSLDCARSHGVSDQMLRGRAKREGWPSPHPGVWIASPARDTRAARHVAASMVVPGPFRGRSTLYVLGTGQPAPPSPELLLPHRLRHRNLPGLDVRRSRHLPDEDLTEIRGLPTTTVPRAVVDLAATHSLQRLRSLAIDLRREGHLDVGDLAACHARLPQNMRGRGRIRMLLDELADSTSDSDTEHDIRTGLLERGYPVHPAPFPFVCDDGVTIELDIALPQYWVYLEVDGRGTHGTGDAFEKDRVKWTQVVRHWRPVWATAQRWRRDRSGLLRDLDAAMALADLRRARAVPGAAAPPRS